MKFDHRKHCCFCGAYNRKELVGYAGERSCSDCGRGGNGESDLPFMAYKGNLYGAPLSSLVEIWKGAGK